MSQLLKELTCKVREEWSERKREKEKKKRKKKGVRRKKGKVKYKMLSAEFLKNTLQNV